MNYHTLYHLDTPLPFNISPALTTYQTYPQGKTEWHCQTYSGKILTTFATLYFKMNLTTHFQRHNFKSVAFHSEMVHMNILKMQIYCLLLCFLQVQISYAKFIANHVKCHIIWYFGLLQKGIVTPEKMLGRPFLQILMNDFSSQF